MSFIYEKRKHFATALERARHSSKARSSSTSSSVNEFNTHISADSLDAFSDPFSSEVSECGSIFDDESLSDLLDLTKWSASPAAVDSLPSTLELCEWDLKDHQDHCPFQMKQNSLDLCCGSDDFLATAEDTMDVLSMLIYNETNIENTQVDLIDMIDNYQFSPVEQTTDNSSLGTKYCDIFYDTNQDTFTILPAGLKPETPKNRILKKDTWLFDRSIDDVPSGTSLVKRSPHLLLISPKPKSSCVMEEFKIKHYTPYISTTPKSSFKTEVGVAIDNNSQDKQTKHKRCNGKKAIMTPEDLLIKKEKNRLRSKAYRERRKLQFETLKEEVNLARLEADIAKKQAKMSSRKR